MRCLQILEVNAGGDIKKLLSKTAKLKQLTISGPPFLSSFEQFFKHWVELKSRPLNFSSITTYRPSSNDIAKFLQYAFFIIQLKTCPTTAKFQVYNSTDLKLSTTFPTVQLQFGASGQVIFPCVKLSDFGMLGLNNDVAVMTDCQYGGRTMYMVRYQDGIFIANKLNSLPITRCDNLSCVTYFDFTNCYLLHSGHLEQLAIVCPNIQRLNLQNCSDCLESLQGLQAVASQCHDLQGLNLLGIHCTHLLIVNHLLLWEILSNMRLIYLALEFCALKSEPANKERSIKLYQKCWTIRGIHCELKYNCGNITDEDITFLSYFPSLNYIYSTDYPGLLPTIVNNVINNCKEIRCAFFYQHRLSQSLDSTHNQNLQQLYIHSTDTDVPDDLLTSVSAHGGLVHVYMSVRSLTVEGVTSLVKNSPKLITLDFLPSVFREDIYVELQKITGSSIRFNDFHFTFYPAHFWDCAESVKHFSHLGDK